MKRDIVQVKSARLDAPNALTKAGRKTSRRRKRFDTMQRGPQKNEQALFKSIRLPPHSQARLAASL
jgi:hypothetical protein